MKLREAGEVIHISTSISTQNTIPEVAIGSCRYEHFGSEVWLGIIIADTKFIWLDKVFSGLNLIEIIVAPKS